MEPPTTGQELSAMTNRSCTTGACRNSSAWASPARWPISTPTASTWHQMARLVRHGCPPRLALRIVG